MAYVSGETFTNHYVAALRDKRMEDFRRAYRSVDVWLVDDVQMLASKEQTKEEFFHTFNVLHQMNKQIVLTSDRSPRELKAMDERLQSRFECGLVADIAPPELEMREAILQKKAILENLAIPDDVITFMANLIQSNIRSLEGRIDQADGLCLAGPQPRHQAACQRCPEQLLCQADAAAADRSAPRPTPKTTRRPSAATSCSCRARR